MDGDAAAARIRQAIGSLDDVIAEVRSAVFALRTDATGRSVEGIRSRVMDLITELAESRGVATSVEFAGGAVPDAATERATTLLRAGIIEVVEYSAATSANIRLAVESDVVHVVLDHDGRPPHERRGILDDVTRRCRARMDVVERDGRTKIAWQMSTAGTS
jgi:signal transduction histidine kinase